MSLTSLYSNLLSKKMVNRCNCKVEKRGLSIKYQERNPTKGEQIMCGQLMSMEELHREEKIPAAVEELLEQFPDVFGKPKGLPPSRGHEHYIQLAEGAQPFKLRPYRYPHYQKAEIEKLIKKSSRRYYPA